MSNGQTASPRILIVGGVAGGASAAAKARRTNEHAEILMFERGPYVSFANCGLPYYVGEDITNRDALLLQTPESFWNRFRIKVMVRHEATRIDRAAKRLEVRNLATGDTFAEPYDKLILSPGAGAIVPPLPGIKAANVFTVKTVPDTDAIKRFIAEHRPRRAAVVGAGFIGLESAEALTHLGMDVTVVEMLPQVLPPFDADIAAFVQRHLEERGVRVIVSDGIKAFHGDGAAGASQSAGASDGAHAPNGAPANASINASTGASANAPATPSPLIREVELQSGRRLPVDLAILSIGVRPELRLAQEAGLTIGEAGGIAVNERQQTSDPDIYAAGDAVEVTHLVTGRKTRLPLAGPANKQGRVAGANAAGASITFPGALGTAIVESLGITAAKTGLSERDARAAGLKSYVSVTHSPDHAEYYPGAELLHIKLTVEQGTGRLLGAQIVGERGVDKRIDVLATALAARMTVTDLEQLDLAYAPQFSSAKDPVIMAGFVASNVLHHNMDIITYDDLRARLDRGDDLQLLDVRNPEELAEGRLDAAALIPLNELRERLHELNPHRETVVFCRVGLRGYLAARILRQHGFSRVLNLTGGLLMAGRNG